MNSARWLGVLVAGMALVPLALAKSPVEVATEVLQAQNQGDAPTVQARVLERCHEQPVASLLPVKVLGAPATLDSLEVSPVKAEGNQATVHWVATGHVEAKDHSTELNLFGVKAQVQVEDLSVEQIRTEGTLELVRLEGKWRVSCPEGS